MIRILNAQAKKKERKTLSYDQIKEKTVNVSNTLPNAKSIPFAKQISEI